jgi:hypothetical protein
VDAAPRAGLRRHPAVAGAFGFVALLLFCWPFVSTPRPSLAAAFVHVFASWAGAVAILGWISRPASPPARAGADADAGGRGRDAP